MAKINFRHSWILILSCLVSSISSHSCPRIEVSGAIVWGPSWTSYHLCESDDPGCERCRQGYTRIFCHQQAQSEEGISENSNAINNKEPIVCAVCFNRNSFHGPECTRDGKLIKSHVGLKQETKPTSNPNHEMVIKDSGDNENEAIFSSKSRSSLDDPVIKQAKAKGSGAELELEESQSLDPVEDRLKIAEAPQFIRREKSFSNAEEDSQYQSLSFDNVEEDSQGLEGNDSQEREMDDTSLMWLGIGGLVFCPFAVVIANGMYKRRHSMLSRIQEVRQFSNISV